MGVLGFRVLGVSLAAGLRVYCDELVLSSREMCSVSWSSLWFQKCAISAGLSSFDLRVGLCLYVSTRVLAQVGLGVLVRRAPGGSG